jgi:hypothetical protein
VRLAVLLGNAYTREAVEQMVARSRFQQGQVTDDGFGFELRLAK